MHSKSTSHGHHKFFSLLYPLFTVSFVCAKSSSTRIKTASTKEETLEDTRRKLPWRVVEDGYSSDFRLTQFFPLLPYHSQD